MPDSQPLSFSADSIVDTVREPMLVLSADLRVRRANRSFYRTFQVTPEETVDRLGYDLGNQQWDIPWLRKTRTAAARKRRASITTWSNPWMPRLWGRWL